LNNVTFPSGATTTGNYTFYQCSGLTNVTFPPSISIIGDYCFYGCTSLSSISLPPALTEIRSHAFDTCSQLKSIDIPPDVRSIEFYAFSNCYNLSEVSFQGNMVSLIDIYAFSACYSLSSIAIPSSVTKLGRYAFNKCISLKNVVLSPNMTTISQGTFVQCDSLSSLDIPPSVETIEYRAFSNMSSLTSFTIPASVTSVEASAFLGSNNLKSISVEYGNSMYESHDGVLFQGKSLALYPPGRDGDYYIRDGTVSINQHAFHACPYLAHITIPASVEKIAVNAFYETPVKSVSYLGNHSMGNDCFYNCRKLDRVCVSAKYPSRYFCTITAWSTSDCELLDTLDSKCYHVKSFISNHSWIVQKDDEAIAWENATDGCVEYKCDNSTGFSSSTLCNNDFGASSFCMVDRQCFTNIYIGKRYIVSMDVQGASIPSESSVEIINRTAKLTNLNPLMWMLGKGMNSKGVINHLYIFVDKKTTADNIKYAVDHLDKGPLCEKGILCNVTSIEVLRDKSVASSSSSSSPDSSGAVSLHGRLSVGLLILSVLFGIVALLIN